jgi:prevent-host-death family protein
VLTDVNSEDRLEESKEGRQSMATVTIQEAQAKLPDLIHQLTPGDELVITENNRPVARLVSEKPPVRQRPGPGLCMGMITIMADDEQHFKGFEDHTP